MEENFERLENADEANAYDALVNACYHSRPEDAMRHLFGEFGRVGITGKQIDRFTAKAKAKGVPVPEVKTGDCSPKVLETILERVVLQSDSKYAKYGLLAHEENPYRNKDEPSLQNLANKFGEFIYNKSFNDGVVGAFGKGQNILTSARGKLIVLRVPRSYQTEFEGKSRSVSLVTKITNSMNHYRKQGNGEVVVEYYD